MVLTGFIRREGCLCSLPLYMYLENRCALHCHLHSGLQRSFLVLPDFISMLYTWGWSLRNLQWDISNIDGYKFIFKALSVALHEQSFMGG